jgi:hypothetical protein
VLRDGTTSFAGLQGHGDAPAALVYFAFDHAPSIWEEAYGLVVTEAQMSSHLL